MRFSRENYVAALQAGEVEEDGVEAAFEMVTDINETVRTGQWVGDCFIYTNSTNRLNYLVGDQTYVLVDEFLLIGAHTVWYSYTIAHFDQPAYMIGYLQRDGRVYVADRDVNVVSYALSLSVVEYQTLVLRGELETANEMLPDIPEDQKNKIARFLEGQGYKEQALEVATDPEHRFELALGLNQLSIALELAQQADVEHKWKLVGDAALAAWNISLAEQCFNSAKDLGSLLLLYSSTGSGDGLRKLAEQADAAGSNNVAFTCLWQLADTDGCIDLLLRSNRIAEAVLFAQTYKPSRAPKIATMWKESLEKEGKSKVARTIGMPPGAENADEELFPEWEEYLRLENEQLERPQENLIDVNGDAEGEDGAGAEPAVNGTDGDVEAASPQTETEV